jgi:hypothetical protein
MPKFTLEFQDKAAEVVKDLSRENGTSQSEIVRKSINLMKFVEDARQNGSKILIQDPDGQTREIVSI